MPGKQPWFERKFDFAFPVERYPDIIERLRGTPAREEEMIRAIPPEILTRRCGDTWSIQENVGHLLTVEQLWYGRLEDILAGARTLRAADLTNRATHEADHNAASISALMESFRAERHRFVAHLEELEPEAFGRSAMHPRLEQPMRLVDLCLFVADHDDYHLARITELKRMSGEPA
jgi:uncharacterized damage-inducible protein DinB